MERNANKGYRQTSKVWKHFTRIPGGAKKVSCNYCKNVISFLTTISNLKSHLNRKHPNIKLNENGTSIPKKVGSRKIVDNSSLNCEYISLAKVKVDPELDPKLDSDSSSNYEPPVPPKKRTSKLWQFYSDTNPSISAECLKCHKDISYKTTIHNLKEHLRRKHPVTFSNFEKLPNGDWSQNNFVDSEFIVTKEDASTFNQSDTIEDPLTEESNKNAIWDYFQQRVDGSDKYAICVLCYTRLHFKKTINPLKEHLKNNHSTTYDQLYETEQSNFVEYEEVSVQSPEPATQMVLVQDDAPIPIEFAPVKKQKVVNPSANGNKGVNDSLILLFTMDLQPFSIVEDEGFIAFVKRLNPLYELPDKITISTHIIPTLYDRSVNNTKAFVINVAKTVCLTIEQWSSHNDETFIGITAHFVTDDFEFKSVYLDTINISNCRKLSVVLKKITEEWGLIDKVSLVVTDNSPSLNDAISELGWKSYVCYTHTLNIFIQEAIMLLDDVFEKIRIYVDYFLTNKAAAKRLFSYQLDSKHDSKELKELITCIPSMWVTVYYMVERFIYLENAIQAVVDDSDNLPLFSEEEWIACKQLCRLLKPFVEVTKKISEEKYMSGSSAIVLTTCLSRAMNNFDLDDTLEGVTKEIHYKLKCGLTENFQTGETNDALATCTFLDPRFKVHGFSRIEGSDDIISLNAQRIKRRVGDIVESMINNEVSTKTAISTSLRDNSTSLNDDYSIWDEFDKVVSNVSTTGSFLSNAIQEVEMYLNDDMLPRYGNPMEWWKSHRFVYPNLSKLFIEKCNVVASSTPCRWLFSESGFILKSRRARLQTSNLREVLFLNANQ